MNQKVMPNKDTTNLPKIEDAYEVLWNHDLVTELKPDPFILSYDERQYQITREQEATQVHIHLEMDGIDPLKWQERMWITALQCGLRNAFFTDFFDMFKNNTSLSGLKHT